MIVGYELKSNFQVETLLEFSVESFVASSFVFIHFHGHEACMRH